MIHYCQGTKKKIFKIKILILLLATVSPLFTLNTEVRAEAKSIVKTESFLVKDSLKLFAAVPTPTPAQTNYTFNDLVLLTKSQNYQVQQEAERVFQARKKVKGAILNLLPHIRARSILAFAFTGWTGLIDAAGDLLPFLFPSNWFKARAEKRLETAELFAFSSLRGNELFDVETLYYSYARDRMLAQLIDQHLNWYEEVMKRLQAEELAGTLPTGSADYFQVNALKLKEDRSNLTEMLWIERLSLVQAAALEPTNNGIDFEMLTPTSLEGAKVLDSTLFQSPAVSKSFELKALDEIVTASTLTRSAIWFSYLDPSAEQAIGFGMGAPIEISRSQTHALEILRASTESLIQQKVVDSTLLFNESITRFDLAKAESSSIQREMIRHIERHDAGDSETDPTKFVDQLSSLENDVLIFELNKLSQQFRAMIAQARLNRLTLQGIYSDLEPIATAVEKKPDENEDNPDENIP